jgi:glycosyltransferase involved in cell wall biosynthesis
MNSPDPDIFEYRFADGDLIVRRQISKPFVIMYHGSLVERHGLDVAVAALSKVRESIPNAQLLIYGRSTEFLHRVLASVEKTPLSAAVRYMGPKNLEGIVEAIRNCDLGVIPNRRSLFTELNTPTRIFEYLSQGKPVIAPRAPGILDYFDEQDLLLFTLGDADDLAKKIEYVFAHPEEVSKIVRRGQTVYHAHEWKSERARFLRLVDGLVGVRHPVAQVNKSTAVLTGSE